MEALVLNSNLQAIDVVDDFESFIWTDRHFKCGDFEIYTSVSDKMLSSLQKDYYLWMDGSEHVMIIEDLQIKADIEQGNNFIVTGRSLESILERRIVWNQTILTGNLQNGIKKLLDENIINPADTTRKIDNFIFEASDDPVITALTIDAQYYGENLYNEVIPALCEANGIGFKVTLTDDNKFKFKLYAGKDRSYSQIVNPYVIFSPSFDNLNNSNYISSKRPLKNVTLVGGEGEGASKRTITVGSGSGLSRREIFTDASSVSSSIDNGVNLFDKSKVKSGFLNSTTGAVETNASYPNSKYGETIEITTGVNYYISGYASAMRYVLYKADGSFNSIVDLTSPGVYLSTLTGTMRPLFYQGITDDQLSAVQIEVGTTATEYAGYKKLTNTQYNIQLTQKGLENLASSTMTESFEGEADTNRMFVYGKDFFMGDIVQIANEYGMETKSRVVELVFSHSTSGIDIYPTFSTV